MSTAVNFEIGSILFGGKVTHHLGRPVSEVKRGSVERQKKFSVCARDRSD